MPAVASSLHRSAVSSSPDQWVSNLESALSGARRIGVEPVMEARDMASPNVEYLGVMAWAAQFQWIADRTPPGDRIEVSGTPLKARVGEEASRTRPMPLA